MLPHRAPTQPAFRTTVVTFLIVSLALILLPASAYAQQPDGVPDEPIPPIYLPYINGNDARAVAQDGAEPETPGDDAVRQMPGVDLPFLGRHVLDLPKRPVTAPGRPGSTPIKLLIDTDPGVDDAIALTWLLSQSRANVMPLGIVTVAGNTNVLAATNNALIVLNKLQQTVPVVMGAAAPLAQPLSKTSWLIHGPDGLWFLGLQNPQDPSGVLFNANDFYCETLADNPGSTLLALGPLTNVANALAACPETMQTLGRVVVLGGAKYGGNKTPVAEFNFWQDPEAADIVLSSGLPLSIVPYDTFIVPRVDMAQIQSLSHSRNPAVRFLAPALQQYVAVQIDNTGSATIPDAVAAVYAVDPAIGTTESSLVQMVLAAGQTRGESVIALSVSERVAMIADDAELSALAERAFTDPNFNLQYELVSILIREPDNAQMLTGVPANLLTRFVLSSLRR